MANYSVEATFSYTDAAGQLVFQIVRCVFPPDPRAISYQCRPSGEPDRWLWDLEAGEFMRPSPDEDWVRFDATEFKLFPASKERKIFNGAPIIPYQLPDLLKAVAAGRTIYIAKNETEVDLIRSFGLPATCCAGGVAKWLPQHSAFLQDADVVLLLDNDHAKIVANSLAPIARRLRILDPVDCSAKEFARLVASVPRADSKVRISRSSEADTKPATELDRKIVHLAERAQETIEITELEPANGAFAGKQISPDGSIVGYPKYTKYWRQSVTRVPATIPHLFAHIREARK